MNPPQQFTTRNSVKKLDQPEPRKRGGVRKKSPKNQIRPKRSDFEFSSLEPSVNLGKRREEVEDVATYVNKLNHEEKTWLNQFMKEYNEATTEDAIFHTKDEILKDRHGNPIMTTNRWGVVTEKSVPLTSRKLCTDRNNERNRCQYTEAVAANRLNLVENDYEMERILHGEEQLETEEPDEETFYDEAFEDD
jgi:hypothetical protein